MATAKPLLTAQLSKSGYVPPHYIRPISDRPTLLAADPSNPSIPLIDFEGFDGPDRPKETDGFFQLPTNLVSLIMHLKNHGIPKSVIEDMVCVAREFFKLPESERLKNYSDDPTKSTRLSTSFNIKKEKVSNWRDYLRLHCYPLEDFVPEWPSNPPAFKLVLHHDHIATFFPKWDPVKVERIADEGIRVQVLIKDVDTKFSSHWVVFRRWKSNRLYVFQSGWSR